MRKIGVVAKASSARAAHEQEGLEQHVVVLAVIATLRVNRAVVGDEAEHLAQSSRATARAAT